MILAILTMLSAVKSAEATTPGNKHVMVARCDDAKGVWMMVGAFSDDAALSEKAAQAADALLGSGATIAQVNAKLLELKLPQAAGGEALVARLQKGMLKVSFVGHLGVLRVRKGTAERVTLPHSIIEDALRTKPDIRVEDAERVRLEAPHRFVTVRSLGKKPEVAVEDVDVPVAKGDRLVIANVDVLAAVGLPELAKAVSGAKTPESAGNELKRAGAKARPQAVPAAIVVFVD